MASELTDVFAAVDEIAAEEERAQAAAERRENLEDELRAVTASAKGEAEQIRDRVAANLDGIAGRIAQRILAATVTADLDEVA